jgi:primosomal protein N' (replication factor Y)
VPTAAAAVGGLAQLVAFCRQLLPAQPGEVALAALPPQLRDLTPAQWQRRLRAQPGPCLRRRCWQQVLTLTLEQAAALAAIVPSRAPSCCSAPPAAARPRSTCGRGRGPAERDPAAQALVMVPEINLTPQLQRASSSASATAVVPCTAA